MSYIQTEIHFLGLIAYGKNIKQVSNTVKEINSNQYKVLQQIAQDLLDGKFSLSKKEFATLKKFKTFIRKLADSIVSKISLRKNLNILRKLIQVSLKENETCRQIHISTNRKMDRNTKRQISRSTDSDSINSDSSEDYKSGESNQTTESSEEEEEEQEQQSIKEKEDISSE